MRYLFLALALMTVPVGCRSILEVDDQRPANDLELLWASQVYGKVSTCIGLANNHTDARYWVVQQLRTRGDPISGGAHLNGDIYIVGDFFREYTLAHEIMHHALWSNTGDGDPHHSHPDWARCADPRVG